MKELIKNHFNGSIENLLETERRIIDMVLSGYDYYKIRNLMPTYISQVFSISDKNFMVDVHIIKFCDVMIKEIDKTPVYKIFGKEYKYRTQIVLDFQKIICSLGSLIQKKANNKDLNIDKINIFVSRRSGNFAKSNREIKIRTYNMSSVCDELDKESMIKAINIIKRFIYIDEVKIVDYELIFDDEKYIEKDIKNFIENKFLSNL